MQIVVIDFAAMLGRRYALDSKPEAMAMSMRCWFGVPSNRLPWIS
jgi:hypothetical protein